MRKKTLFLTTMGEKTTFWWPKEVSEVIFPLIGGIFGLKRWSKIFGLEIIRGTYESKEKAIFSF